MKNQIIIGLLILQGFTYKTAKQYIRLKKKYDRTSVGKYSFKQIMSVMPFGKCDKIFEDALSTQRALYKYRANMPVFYGIRLKRDNDLIYCPLEDERVLDSNEIITLVKDTALARVILVEEIILRAEDFIIRGFIWPLFYSALFYLVFVGVLTLVFRAAEKKLSYFKV